MGEVCGVERTANRVWPADGLEILKQFWVDA